LVSRGVLVTSISGADNYWSPELLSYGRTVYQTMKAVFPEIIITPGDEHYLFAAKTSGVITDEVNALADRYRRRHFSSPYFTPRSFLLFFPPTGVEYLKYRLAQPGPSQLNTDAVPLSYYLRLVWWGKMTGSRLTRTVLGSALRVRSWGPWLGIALCLPLLAVFFRPTAALAAPVTVAMTGGATMALQIIMIFLFQNKNGIIYQQIGLLSALFMAGLAGGGLLGRTAVGGGIEPRKALPLLEFLLAGLCIAIALIAWERLPHLIYSLVALTGLVSGGEFAFLFSLYLKDRGRPTVTRAMAALESADHGGAVFGSILTGMILAPVLGLGATAVGLAGIKLLNALVLLRPVRT
jgi:hypothetical protein